MSTSQCRRKYKRTTYSAVPSGCRALSYFYRVAVNNRPLFFHTLPAAVLTLISVQFYAIASLLATFLNCDACDRDASSGGNGCPTGAYRAPEADTAVVSAALGSCARRSTIKLLK
jgi:hypothetical protein